MEVHLEVVDLEVEPSGTGWFFSSTQLSCFFLRAMSYASFILTSSASRRPSPRRRRHRSEDGGPGMIARPRLSAQVGLARLDEGFPGVGRNDAHAQVGSADSVRMAPPISPGSVDDD